RSLLFDFSLPSLNRTAWTFVEAAVLGLLARMFYKDCRSRYETKPSFARLAFAFSPLIVACFLMPQYREGGPWVWLLCLISLLIASTTALENVQGLWLSFLALAFFRSVGGLTNTAFLGIATLVGWNFSLSDNDRHPLREGLAIFGL